MQVKIDTKEKFHVLTPMEQEISANMTENLVTKLLHCLESDVKNVVLNLSDVDKLDEHAAKTILGIQQKFYEQNHSFVVCCLTKTVENMLDEMNLLELMNVTPTESEAWDIVQMEEIEREFLDGE